MLLKRSFISAKRRTFAIQAQPRNSSPELRREAFGVRRIPALSIRTVRKSHTAPEYGALQTLRAVQLRASDFGLLSGFGLRVSAFLLTLFVSFPFLSPLCHADDLADKGRAIFKQHQHAVVTVQLVLKSKFSVGGRGGESNESRQDVTGTVVDPSGLTALPLSATAPSHT